MYDFNDEQRRALEPLSRAERLVAERWVELTHEDTHPHWRCRPRSGQIEIIRQQLETAVRSDEIDSIPGILEELSGLLLSYGRSRDWQHKAVLSFLIDQKQRNKSLDFLARLRALTVDDNSRSFAESTVTLEWRITEDLPANARLPWRDPSLVVGADRREYSLIERGKGADRHWIVTTAVEADEPLAIARAATEMLSDATSLLDLLRIAYSDAGIFRSHRIVVVGSSRLSYVRLRPLPRVRTRAHARDAVRTVFNVVKSDPTSEISRRLLGAARWFSTAIVRWPESPRFATGTLWMALESLFGKCVIRHDRCRHSGQLTAADLYAEVLFESLADEIENYLLRVRGTAADRGKSIRNPPRWLSGRISRDGRDPRQWAADIVRKVPSNERQEPSLVWHCYSLAQADQSMVIAARSNAQSYLQSLKKMRNSLAHEGNPLLRDDEADFLAAFAAEILFMAFQNPDSLHIEETAA